MGSDPVPLKSLAVATVGLVAIEGLARWAIVQTGIYPLTGIGLARLFDIAWMVLVISRSPHGWSRIGLARAEWLFGLKKGFFWSAGFGILAAAGYTLLHLIGFDPTRIIRPDPAALLDRPALIFAVGGLIAPIAEEMYFRGVMFGYCRRWGFWPALILSTLVFTLMHGNALDTATPQLVGGIVFALAYEIEKSLLTPIAIHILGNTAIFTLAFLI
jgi:membrane protease YdiL (CAAX protease family)